MCGKPPGPRLASFAATGAGGPGTDVSSPPEYTSKAAHAGAVFVAAAPRPSKGGRIRPLVHSRLTGSDSGREAAAPPEAQGIDRTALGAIAGFVDAARAPGTALARPCGRPR